MANTVKARIQLKCDTEENWNKTQGRFIPLKGEIIIYSADDSHPFPRLKTGNGVTSVIDLPFLAAEAMDQTIQYHTTAYWNSQLNYIPSQGKILIYLDQYTIEKNNSTIYEPAIKIGDGTTYLVDLPFLNDIIYTQLNNHINNSTIHISTTDRDFWDNKINCQDYVVNETLQLTRR